MTLGTRRVRMDVQISEVPSEPLLLVEIDLLVAKEQDLMLRQRIMQVFDLPIAQLGGKIDVRYLGAKRWRQGLHLYGGVNS